MGNEMTTGGYQRCALLPQCEVLTPEEIHALRDIRSLRCRQLMLSVIRMGRHPGSPCAADMPECHRPSNDK
jgi:hypothetical protein